MIHPHEETVKDVFKMIKSLDLAVSEAGGTPYFYDRHKNWTLEQIVIVLATNGIRFVYEAPEPKILDLPSIDYRP